MLFDQNISFRIIEKIQSIFPNSKQVRAAGLEDASDTEIWNYAKTNDFTIVTFDADFADIANMKGSPPKIIWLRTGNMTTKNIVEILKKHHSTIKEFVDDVDFREISCMEIE